MTKDKTNEDIKIGTEEYDSYDAVVADQLRIADARAASGEMKDYSTKEIRNKLEEMLGEDL